MWWGEFYGALTLVAVLVTWANSKRHPDAFGLALMLMVAWALTNVMDTLWDPPASKAFNSVTDLTIGLMALWAWYTRRAAWKLNLALLFGVQSFAHVLYQGWFGATVEFTTYNYEAFLNATFALQLGCVVWPGGRDALVRAVARLRHRPVARSHNGAAP